MTDYVVVVIDNRNTAVPSAEVYGPFDTYTAAQALADELRVRVDDPGYPEALYWTFVTRLHGRQGFEKGNLQHDSSDLSE